MEAWQKLIRVLTHEIMNSLAPITSLSDTLLHLGRRLDADVERGLDTISSTSRRLTAFVETFRRFTRIPEPRKSAFEVRGMLERAVMLAGVSDVVRLDVEPSQMLIYADEGLVEQVAVNLLKNAREAAEGLSDGRIEVVARTFAAGKYGAETTSEEPFVESQWFAPSSLVATALEKKVQREYSAKLHELVRNGQVAA